MIKKILLLLIHASFLAGTDTFMSLYNTAITIHKDQPELALTLLNQALMINDQSLEVHYMIAYLLKNKGCMTHALPHYKRVLLNDPDHVSAHIGIAQAHLMLGNFDEGWQELEWRLGRPPACTKEFKAYLEKGGSLHHKKIVLRAEWGIGDTLMLIRYAKLLHDKGAYVMVHLIHESLIPLLKQQPYIDEVWGPQDPCPPFHFQIPMVSLPMVFKTNVSTIPNSIPYIYNDKQEIKKITLDKRMFTIGICWHGNTIHGEEKFMPLPYFAQLAYLPGITLYSLQQRHGLDQIAHLKDSSCIQMFDASFDCIPFLDTIAIMKQLNLVITVDTSLAHLAGALGVPVWVILPEKSDWRWLESRSDTPWYPTMRLFRQNKYGDWQTVITQVKEALLSSIIIPH